MRLQKLFSRNIAILGLFVIVVWVWVYPWWEDESQTNSTPSKSILNSASEFLDDVQENEGTFETVPCFNA
jgi:hypothetical protein